MGMLSIRHINHGVKEPCIIEQTEEAPNIVPEVGRLMENEGDAAWYLNMSLRRIS